MKINLFDKYLPLSGTETIRHEINNRRLWCKCHEKIEIILEFKEKKELLIGKLPFLEIEPIFSVKISVYLYLESNH